MSDNKKYEFTGETKNGLKRIRAIKTFGLVLKGTLGGFIETEANLTHEGNVWVSGDAQVYGNAQVSGNARVFGDAWVSGNAQVFGNARVYGEFHAKYGSLTSDIAKDIKAAVQSGVDVRPVGGQYRLYKRVNKTSVPGLYQSNYDANFTYEVGEWVSVDIPTDDDPLKSCAAGIHVCSATYWDEGDTLIAVDVMIDDIITCMGGKIRARRVFVVGECD